MIDHINAIVFAVRDVENCALFYRHKGVKRTHCVVFVADLEAEYRELSCKGVHFVDPPKTQAGGWRTAHFEDPNGNPWEIIQRPRA